VSSGPAAARNPPDDTVPAARPGGTGYVEDIVARTDAACLIDIHLKRTSYREALRSGRLALDGPPQLTSAFMTWIRPSPYAGITAAPSARPRNRDLPQR
jgi:hypothetical protein